MLCFAEISCSGCEYEESCRVETGIETGEMKINEYFSVMNMGPTEKDIERNKRGWRWPS